MAAPKPISLLNLIITALISLNNNFGTLLTLVLGCFPFDIQPYRTMSENSSLISQPFRAQIHNCRILRPPQ